MTLQTSTNLTYQHIRGPRETPQTRPEPCPLNVVMAALHLWMDPFMYLEAIRFGTPTFSSMICTALTWQLSRGSISAIALQLETFRQPEALLALLCAEILSTFLEELTKYCSGVWTMTS